MPLNLLASGQIQRGGQRQEKTKYTAGPLAGVTIANSYDTLGRRTALAASHASRITSNAFAYDDASRLKTVSDGENTAAYDYLANSPLWGQISFDHNGVKQMTTTRQFDRLNRLKSISSSGGASSGGPIISAFDYQYNQANQRVKAALEDESHWDYTYDSLGQLTSGKKQSPNRVLDPDQNFEYTHDDIGNRIVTGGRESSRARYAANALNQYTRRDDLQTAGKTTGFQYDADGNLVGDDHWIYTWDAENRLLGMESAPGIPSGQRKRLEFAYDSQSRRIGKKVYELQGNRWSLATELRFVYDGWNLLAELSTDHRPLSTYLWGLDLSGNLHGAGGVGGLLMATERGGSVSQRYMVYDGNGNVVALIDAQTGNALDRFRYDPFGNELGSSNHRSIRNPFRFSTKYHDEETGVLYYGYRYYQPASGKWPSRDPVGELGFRISTGTSRKAEKKDEFHLYFFVANNAISNWDYLGLDNPGCDLPSWLQPTGSNRDCYLRCCALHDGCYFTRNGRAPAGNRSCTAASWALNAGQVGGAIAGGWGGTIISAACGLHPCAGCNNDVVACFAKCAIGIDNGGSRWFCPNGPSAAVNDNYFFL